MTTLRTGGVVCLPLHFYGDGINVAVVVESDEPLTSWEHGDLCHGAGPASKRGKPIEFGRCVWLEEVDGGIISRCPVLDGYPDAKAQLALSMDQHIHQFGHPPDLLSGDRELHSTANDCDAQQHGVREVVLPKPGTKAAKQSAYEQQDWSHAGHNWRAGIAGRISRRKRRHRLDRCRYHGTAGMERWIGLAVIASDLHSIARHLTA